MIAVLLFLSVAVGVFVGYFFLKNQKSAKNLLILSAGFLMTICLTDVFPEIFGSGSHNAGFYVLGGVLLQLFLENLTKGFEHGHFHHNSGNIMPFALITGMFVHAFIEGIPLSDETSPTSPYLLGILFHNLPISIVLGAFIAQNKISAGSWFTVISFALASPLGLLFGNYIPKDFLPKILALVGGIFLHISSVIIFESNTHHKMDWQKIAMVICGAGLGAAGHFLH